MEGTPIRYAIGDSSLGKLLVAASARGSCAIWFGDGEQSLRNEIARVFPQAVPACRGDLQPLLDQAAALAASPARAFDAPLDAGGTDFQKRVWRALRTIAAGSTISYRELAERAGVPGAVRAVAGACAANRLAIAIPCHRVVRSDGALSGYRWGVERKRELLQREACS